MFDMNDDKLSAEDKAYILQRVSQSFPDDANLDFASTLNAKDGLDAVYNLTVAEMKLLEQMESYTEKRSQLDIDYAEKLARLHEKMPVTDPDPHLSRSSIEKAWRAFMSESENKAITILNQGKLLKQNTIPRIKKLISVKTEISNNFKSNRTLYETQFSKNAASVDRLLELYKDSLKEAVKYREKLDDERSRRSEKDWSKVKDRLEKAAQKLHTNHNEYVLLIAGLNIHQQHYQQNLMTKLLSAVQQVQESSVIPWKEVLLEIQSNTSWCLDEFLSSEKELKQSIDLISSKEEYSLFITNYRRHPTAIIPYFFEDSLLEDERVTVGLLKDSLAVNELTHKQLQDRKKTLENEDNISSTSLKIKTENYEVQNEKIEEIKNLGDDVNKLSMVEHLIQLHNIDLELKEIACKSETNKVQYDLIQKALTELGHEEPKNYFDINPISFDGPVKLPNKKGYSSSTLSRSDINKLRSGASTFNKFMSRGTSFRHRQSSIQDVFSITSGSSSSSINGTTSTSSPEVQSNDYDSDVSYEEPYESLVDSTWYHGKIDRSQVNTLLKQDGDFIVREKSDNSGDQVLSVLWRGHTKHFILKPDENNMYKLEAESFSNIPALINHHHNKRLVIQASTGIILVNPIKRKIGRGDKFYVVHSKVKLDEKLGSGHFGDVFRGRVLPKGTPVAVKTLKQNVGANVKEKFLEEAEIMKSCDHCNVIKLIGVCSDDEPYYILLELCEKGDLQKLLKNEGSHWNRARLIYMSKNIADGMSYLEYQQIIHRDLAARNCLVTKDYQVKISDFGMSRQEDDQNIYRMVETREIPFKWCAPEVWSYKRCSTKSDVWAFGIVLWEIFSLGMQPYPGLTNKEAREKIDRGYRMPAPSSAPSDMYEIMKRCWQDNENDRPSFQQIVELLSQIH